MSRGVTLSIMGLYNQDNTVLDLMEFPEDFTEEQKQTVKKNILVECAEFEFLYPNPTVAKNIIGLWSRKEQPYWDRVYKASLLEYDPIENYRRNEQESISDGRTEEHSGVDSTSSGGTDTASRSGSDTTTGNSGSTDTESGTDTVTNKITGFDSNTLVDHDSSATLYGHKNTNTANGTNTTTYGTVDSREYGRTDSIRHGEKIEHSGGSERSLLAFGNIGTMTSQDMLTQELEVAKIVQVVPIIIESFKNRFCLMVY